MRLCTAPIVLSAALIAACGTPGGNRPYWMSRDSGAFVGAVDSMIAYHAYVNGLNAPAWQKERESLRAETGGEASLCLRRAMLSAATAAPAAERAQAAAAIVQCERELLRDGSPLRGLAALLRAEQLERQRSDERQRDAARRAEDLAAKLDELKAIEKSLLERSRTGSRPKPP